MSRPRSMEECLGLSIIKELSETLNTGMIERGFGMVGKDDNAFTLASGKKSKYYFDIKGVMFDKYTRFVLFSLIRNVILEFKPNSIGGPADAAYMLVFSQLPTQLFLDGFVVRNDRKDHGLKLKVVGTEPIDDKRILILEDVITTGGSLLPTLEYVDEVNPSADTQVLCVVDRMADGKFEADKISAYRERGMIHSFFKSNDFWSCS